MTNKAPNPWLCTMPGYGGAEILDAVSRLHIVQASNDLAELERYRAYPHNQKAVQAAIERRMRRLARAAAKEARE